MVNLLRNADPHGVYIMKQYRFQDIENKIVERRLLYPVDVLLVGGTGTGKSSTLNAIFGTEVAKVGSGVDPETKVISAHKIHDYLRFHDSAGLGDGKATDFLHSKNITYELLKPTTINDKQYGFIDIVLVLLDGSLREMGTTYNLLESVVLKSIEPGRVIVAINQADLAMKGRYWNLVTNRPEKELAEFLEDKANSVIHRLHEATGLKISKPVCYSALYGYNINALMDHIIHHLPVNRRLLS